MDQPTQQRNILIPILIAASVLVGIATHKYIFDTQSKTSLLNRNESKVDQLLEKIVSNYVDTVDYDSIQEQAIPEIVRMLDPHSIYIPAELKQEVDEPMQGAFDGIGVQFNIRKDTVMVVRPIAGGPSEKVGILGGDRIVEVNDTVIAGVNISTREVMKKLKGPRGTKVKVGIKRHGTDELIDFTIIRDKIPLYSVDVSYMVSKSTGYLKLSKFSRTTYMEFMEAVAKLKTMGMKNLVVDLRGNGGGIMESSIRMADEFLEPGKLIVYTQGNNRPKREYRASAQGFLINTDVAVLLDEWSASASEIFAGALQDNDVGVIMGRRSFGKGLVQEPIYFEDGSELRLTVARYYSPTGRSIQKPYEQGDEESYREDITRRYLNGEFMEKDSIHFSDEEKFITPKGKVVYGGGGIMPDIFIPVDTSASSDFLINVRKRGLMYSFAYEYTDKNREYLSKYTDYKELEEYLSQERIFSKFVKFARNKGLKVAPMDLKTSGEVIEVQVMGLVVRNVIGEDGFYPIIQKIDKTLEQAVEELNN